jgi:multidrug transporter EmrE-like cation transporter
MYTLMVVIAALSFSVGGFYMKLSDGFARLVPTVLVFALFMLGAGLQTAAMRDTSLSVTYLFVLGLEAVLAFGLGVVFLKEGYSALKVFGTLLVIFGILLLHLGDVPA